MPGTPKACRSSPSRDAAPISMEQITPASIVRRTSPRQPSGVRALPKCSVERVGFIVVLGRNPFPPLAGEGGPKGRMRGIERSEMAPLGAGRSAGDHPIAGLQQKQPFVLNGQSHLAPLDSPHPPRFARHLPPQGASVRTHHVFHEHFLWVASSYPSAMAWKRWSPRAKVIGPGGRSLA